MRCSHDVGALKKSSGMDVFVTHSLLSLLFSDTEAALCITVRY